MDLRISSKIFSVEEGFSKSKSILKTKFNINESIKPFEEKDTVKTNLFGLHSLKSIVLNSSQSSSGAQSISSDGEANSIDDDLTNLTWLHDGNLLQNLCQAQNIKENCVSKGDGISKRDYELEENSFDDANQQILEEDNKKDSRVPYNPLIHVNTKPPYSFSCLIFMAIEESPNKALPVKEIYSWIILHFPYFRHAPNGWKNSVRHNLSLNKCFCKVDKSKTRNIGKGSLWCVDAGFRPNLLQALRRAPLCPFSECNDKELAGFPSIDECDSLSQSPNQPGITPSLFPFLSKRLCNAIVIDDKEVDVASTMLNLKDTISPRNYSTTKNNCDTSNKRKDAKKKKRYSDLGSNGERDFLSNNTKIRKTDNVTTRSNNSTSNNATPYVDHTYSASNQLPRHNQAASVAICEKESNNDAKLMQKFTMERKLDENESSEYSEMDERVSVAKHRSTSSTQSVIVDGTKLKNYAINERDEDRSLEEGAHALLSLANIGNVRNATS